MKREHRYFFGSLPQARVVSLAAEAVFIEDRPDVHTYRFVEF